MPRITITTLGYADDVVLLADTPAKLQEQIRICGRWGRRNGMRFNTEKCKVLALNAPTKKSAFSL